MYDIVKSQIKKSIVLDSEWSDSISGSSGFAMAFMFSLMYVICFQ